MMSELLARLLSLFNTELVQTDYLASIHILDTFSSEVLLKPNHMPCLVITPMTERHEPGPFENTSREIFAIRLRIIARSADTYAYQVDPISGTVTNKTIHWLSEQVRKVLFANKRLVDSTFEMRPTFTITDLNVLWSNQSGQYSARDINIEYTQLEGYTGMQNNQASLDPTAF